MFASGQLSLLFGHFAAAFLKAKILRNWDTITNRGPLGRMRWTMTLFIIAEFGQ